jgi:hypothetical protein
VYSPRRQAEIRQQRLEVWEQLGRELVRYLDQMRIDEIELMYGETIADIIKRMRAL